LKPDVSPPRRRSVGATVPTQLSLERSGAPYLVRLIKPNLIASHDWHVQPICQRSLRVIRLSGTPWIEVRTCVRLSSNLMRNADFVCLYCRLRRFGANLLTLSKPVYRVKLSFAPNHCG